MKTNLSKICVATALLTCLPFLHADEKGEALGKAVVKASGGENWPNVKMLDFTFNVAQGDKTLASVKHHWDVSANKDAVEWSGKKATVDLAEASATSDAKEAMKRWTNDSYWLLAPLKLCDRGTKLTSKGEQQIEGNTFHVLEVSFESVGLTPHDKYNLYIDPKTNLVRRWDYMPSADKKVTGTWDGYKDFGGLKLATEHQFGDKRIYFTDIKVIGE